MADRNKKIILKVLDSIPSSDFDIADSASHEQLSADEDNKRKLKAVYKSCLDVDRLNERGLEPLLPLVHTITDIVGSFTELPPAKDENEPFDSAGAAVEEVQIPEHVQAAGVRAREVKERKLTAWPVVPAAEEELEVAKKHERAKQITQALAWLHSQGQASFFFSAAPGR